MGRTKLLWRTAGAIGLLASLLFVGGFVYAVNDLVNPKGENTPRQPDKPPAAAAKDGLQLVALGDSLTRGYGDVSGDGYVGKVKKALEQSGQKVYVSNNGRNGATTSELQSYLQQQPTQELVKQADIILMTIGGNDLNQSALSGFGSGQAVGQQTVPELNYAETAKKLPEAAGRLDAILTQLHNLNPNARIVYVALYNPYLEADPTGEGTQVLQDWNTRAFTAAARLKNITVVPTFDLFQNQGDRFLFSDGFHPNAEGYSRIAERVVQVLQ